MVSLKEIKFRTGLSDSDARIYKDMAEDRVRLYLNYKSDEDVSRFSSVVSDIAVILYEKETESKAAQKAWIENAGIQSKHYQEGSVSVSETYSDGGGTSSVCERYEARTEAALQTLRRYRRVRVYGSSMDADKR